MYNARIFLFNLFNIVPFYTRHLSNLKIPLGLRFRVIPADSQQHGLDLLPIQVCNGGNDPASWVGRVGSSKTFGNKNYLKNFNLQKYFDQSGHVIFSLHVGA